METPALIAVLVGALLVLMFVVAAFTAMPKPGPPRRPKEPTLGAPLAMAQSAGKRVPGNLRIADPFQICGWSQTASNPGRNRTDIPNPFSPSDMREVQRRKAEVQEERDREYASIQQADEA